LAEQNEALIKPLTEACQAYIVDCKKKYPEVELGDYIEEVKTINTDRKCTFLRGVGNQGFISPRQVRTNESLKICTLFHKGDLVYNPSVLFAGAIALNSDFDEAICTEEYVVFRSKDTKILLPEFIFIWLKRKEMGRYFWFSNMDSVRNRIYFEDTCKIGIPLPPPEVQQAIVDIYNCAEEAKKIANDAREKIKNLCPALVQRALNG
jgi:type I restriction enzyme S subunit